MTGRINTETGRPKLSREVTERIKRYIHEGQVNQSETEMSGRETPSEGITQKGKQTAKSDTELAVRTDEREEEITNSVKSENSTFQQERDLYLNYFRNSETADQDQTSDVNNSNKEQGTNPKEEPAETRFSFESKTNEEEPIGNNN